MGKKKSPLKGKLCLSDLQAAVKARAKVGFDGAVGEAVKAQGLVSSSGLTEMECAAVMAAKGLAGYDSPEFFLEVEPSKLQALNARMKLLKEGTLDETLDVQSMVPCELTPKGGELGRVDQGGSVGKSVKNGSSGKDQSMKASVCSSGLVGPSSCGPSDLLEPVDSVKPSSSSGPSDSSSGLDSMKLPVGKESVKLSATSGLVGDSMKSMVLDVNPSGPFGPFKASSKGGMGKVVSSGLLDAGLQSSVGGGSVKALSSGLVGESQSVKGGPVGASSGPIGPSKGMGSSSNKGEVRSWTALFGTPNSSSTSKLQFVPPRVVNGRRVVVPSEDIVNEGIKLWQCSLVGQFVDSRVPFPVLSRLVNRIWGHLEEPSITMMESGLIVFQFRQEASCDWILSNGPWHIGGKPLLLRKWFPGIVPQTFSFDSVPIWVKLTNLPLELWTSSGISVVASAVGKPVCLDKATEERRRLSFARVCVEIEPKDELPSSVDVCVRGTDFVIPVEYAWIPRRCPHCCVFGHSFLSCASRPKQGHVVSSVQPSPPSPRRPVAEVTPKAGARPDPQVPSQPSTSSGTNQLVQVQTTHLTPGPVSSGANLQWVQVLGKERPVQRADDKRSPQKAPLKSPLRVSGCLPVNPFAALGGDVESKELALIQGDVDPPPLASDSP